MFFFPYKIERDSDGIAWVTLLMILTNVVLFFATWFQLGTIAPYLALSWSPNAVYTWFTSMFLHVDLLHLAFNMYFLWLFGSFVENVMGQLRYFLFYCAGGLAAGATHLLFTALLTPQYMDRPAIGASGALAAVMGLFAVRFYRHKMRIAYLIFIKPGVWKPSALVGIGLWFAGELYGAAMLATGLDDGVARWAHIGGLVFGVAYGLLAGATYAADNEYMADEAEEYSASGAHNIAADRYRQLTIRTPDDPGALLGAASAYFASHTDDPSAGADSLRRAVELLVAANDTDRIVNAWERMRGPASRVTIDSRTLSTIASVSEGKDRFDLAAEAYWRVVQEHPGSPQAERALFRLAHIYRDSDMHDSAQQCWGRFCAEYPNSQWMQYADARLTTGA